MSQTNGKSSKIKIFHALGFFYLICISVASSAISEVSKNVSLELQDVPLGTALQLMAEQTKYDIIFSDRLVKDIEVSCTLENILVEDALEQLLQNTSVAVQIFGDNQIVLLAATTEATKASKRATLFGRILDGETDEPLEAVNVFLANTLMGSSTNDKGEFVIDSIPFGTFDLISSRLGYEVDRKKFVVTQPIDESMEIKLNPKPIQAPEISISASAVKNWEMNLDKFKTLFFSATENAIHCEILNPHVLDFSKDGRRFVATAQAPLLIENRALGYVIYYVLEIYTASDRLIMTRGFSRFEELIPETQEEAQTWQQNRLKAYNGSIKHFLATLCKEAELTTAFNQKIRIDNDFLAEAGFNVFTVVDPWRKLKKQRLYNTNRILYSGETKNQRRLDFPDYLMLHYTKEATSSDYFEFGAKFGYARKQISMLTLTGDSILIDTSGNVCDKNGLRADGIGIRTYGYWSWERMADRLPWDYIPGLIDAN